MIEERRLYKRLFEEKWYSMTDNIIWAEDLFDVEVYVYSGKLSVVPGYRDYATEDYRLIVVNHNMMKIEALEVMADVEANRLYLPMSLYKLWRMDIGVSIDRYKRSKYIEGDAEKHIHKLKATKKRITVKVNSKVSNEERHKQSLLDNNAYSYFYEYGSNVFHDRNCREIEHILSDKLVGIKDYPAKMQSCRKCQYASLVRKACAPRIKQIPIVMEILKLENIGYDLLKMLVVDNEMRFEAYSKDELIVRINEDKWLITNIGSKKKHLWHNNYQKINDNRVMGKGYHDQKLDKEQLFDLLWYTVKYDWRSFHVIRPSE